MSRTYRKAIFSLQVCKNCGKNYSSWGKPVGKYKDKCKCWESYPKYFFQIPLITVNTYSIRDGSQNISASRKEYQTIRNRQFRAKTRQVLTDRSVEMIDKVFPIVKKEVDWDIW